MIGACHMKTKPGSWQIPYSIDRLLYLQLVLVTFRLLSPLGMMIFDIFSPPFERTHFQFSLFAAFQYRSVLMLTVTNKQCPGAQVQYCRRSLIPRTNPQGDGDVDTVLPWLKTNLRAIANACKALDQILNTASCHTERVNF